MATAYSLREWQSVTVTRDVLFEILRGSSALSYLSGVVLENNTNIDEILHRKLGRDGVPLWINDFQNHMNQLRRSQVLISRDLNTLFDQPRDLEVLRLLGSHDTDFQDIKSIRNTCQKPIDATYSTTQRHLPYPGQSYSQDTNGAKLESIRQSLVTKPQPAEKPTSTPMYTTATTYSRTTVQPATVPAQQGSSDSGPVVTPARDVLVQERGLYSIKNREGFSAKYNSPDEGFVQTLNEQGAIVTERLTTTPSSYIRVIKEYKGEEYILKGSKPLREDGSRSPTPVRFSVASRSRSPNTRSSMGYTQVTRTDQAGNNSTTPHTSAINKDLFKDDQRQDKPQVVVSNFDPADNRSSQNTTRTTYQPGTQNSPSLNQPSPTHTASFKNSSPPPQQQPSYQPSTTSYQQTTTTTTYQPSSAAKYQPTPSQTPASYQPSTTTTVTSKPQSNSIWQPQQRLHQPRSLPPLPDDPSYLGSSSTTSTANPLSASDARAMVTPLSSSDKPLKIDISSLSDDGSLPSLTNRLHTLRSQRRHRKHGFLWPSTRLCSRNRREPSIRHTRAGGSSHSWYNQENRW